MGQFNSGYRRPNFSGSKDFYSSSTSSLAPVPASQSKSKKKLLIISLITVITIVIIILLLTTLNAKKSTNLNGASEFTKFVNLILYKQDTDKELMTEEYNSHETYAIEDMLYSNDGDNMKKALLSLEGFIEILEEEKSQDQEPKTMEGERTDVYDLAITEKDLLLFLMKYAESGQLYIDDIFTKYQEAGKEAAINYVNEFIEPYQLIEESSYAQDYAVELQEFTQRYISALDGIDLANCVGSEGCHVQPDMDLDGVEIDYFVTDYDYIYEKIQLLERYCWLMGDEIKSGE